MGWAWHNFASRIAPVEQRFTLQTGQTASLEFTPVLEGVSYSIGLEFDKTQKASLDCDAIQSLNIRWTVSRDGKPLQTGDLHGPNAMCDDKGKAVEVNFPAPDLILNHQHLLNLSLADKRQREIQLQSRVSINAMGLGVHYAFMNLAAQELALYALLIFGFGCFSPDVYSFVFDRKLYTSQ